MADTQWARLRTALKCPLRRGAWYRVLSLTRLEVTVDVHGASVALPRSHVELRTVVPRDWTVVRTAEGSEYVVCPNCGHRAVLPLARVLKLTCPR